MKKAVVLVIVWGIALVLTFLAMTAIYLMRNQAFVSEYRIRRLMAYYTARAAMYHALEELRKGNTSPASITLNHGDPADPLRLTATIAVSAPDANGIRTLTINATY